MWAFFGRIIASCGSYWCGDIVNDQSSTWVSKQRNISIHAMSSVPCRVEGVTECLKVEIAGGGCQACYTASGPLLVQVRAVSGVCITHWSN